MLLCLLTECIARLLGRLGVLFVRVFGVFACVCVNVLMRLFR